MPPAILLYRDDEGMKYSVYGRGRTQGWSVIPSARHFPDAGEDYVGGIMVASASWTPGLQIKAGVPDDADKSKHPLPLDEIIIEDIRKRIEKKRMPGRS